VIGSLRPLGENRPLLVDRGWIVANAARRTEPPAIRTPDGTVTVEGRIHSRFPRALLSGDPTPGAVRQNLEIEEFSRETRMEFLPFVIEQSSFSEDGLIRRDTAAGPGSEKHRMYSLQWYSFAGLIVVLAGVFGIRRR
jgi:surfeit locus 1 family protein